MQINAETVTDISCEIQTDWNNGSVISLLTDSTTYVPFILIDGNCRALVMFDYSMSFKSHVFLEQSRRGWIGNGTDWTLLAQVVVAERFSPTTETVTYDSDTEIFSARGSRATLEKLGFELQAIFKNDDAIRYLMSRVKKTRRTDGKNRSEKHRRKAAKSDHPGSLQTPSK